MKLAIYVQVKSLILYSVVARVMSTKGKIRIPPPLQNLGILLERRQPKLVI